MLSSWMLTFLLLRKYHQKNFFEMLKKLYCPISRHLSRSSRKLFHSQCSTSYQNDKKTSSSSILSKFESIADSRPHIILDVEEERRKALEKMEVIEDINPFEGISRTRGETGVIEIEELVTILRNESAVDIFVASVPEKYNYVDYLVVVTGRSARHMKAMAEFTMKVFKFKSQGNDVTPRIEGKKGTDWIAIDLGNIALHIFSPVKRKKYDLETLWSVGPEFDTLTNQPDHPVIALLKQHSIYLEKPSELS